MSESMMELIGHSYGASPRPQSAHTPSTGRGGPRPSTSGSNGGRGSAARVSSRRHDDDADMAAGGGVEPTAEEVRRARALIPIHDSHQLSFRLHQLLITKDAPRAQIKATVPEAITMLSVKIASRLPSGPYGVIRCWMQFREKAGASKDGVRLHEFRRALTKYGLEFPDSVSQGVFDCMDHDHDGNPNLVQRPRVTGA